MTPLWDGGGEDGYYFHKYGKHPGTEHEAEALRRVKAQGSDEMSAFQPKPGDAVAVRATVKVTGPECVVTGIGSHAPRNIAPWRSAEEDAAREACIESLRELARPGGTALAKGLTKRIGMAQMRLNALDALRSQPGEEAGRG